MSDSLIPFSGPVYPGAPYTVSWTPSVERMENALVSAEPFARSVNGARASTRCHSGDRAQRMTGMGRERGAGVAMRGLLLPRSLVLDIGLAVGA